MTLRRPLVSRLKLAVMTPFVAFVAVLATSVATIEYQKFRRDSARIALEIRDAIGTGFRGAVASEAVMLHTAAQAIAHNDGFRAAFARGDRQRLADMARPLFADLRESGRITHLYFTDAARVSLLRAHEPERHGDVINRHTTLVAERTGAVAEGIELGPLGTLTLRVVLPWTEGGRLLGYIETGKEIDHLFLGLRQQFGLHPLVFVPKDRLDRAGWEAGMAMLGRSAHWDEFEDVVLSLRNGIGTDVIRLFLAGRADRARVGDRWYSWLRLDVPDASGGTAAVVGLVMDVTAAHDEIMRFGALVTAIALVGSAVVIAVFWLVMDRVEAELMRARDRLARREARYHGMFTDCRAAQMLISPGDGRIVEANPTALAFYGWPAATLTAMGVADLAAPGEITPHALDESRHHLVLRHRLASGDVRDVEVFSGPIPSDDGPLLHWIIRDVTLQRQAEAERERANAVIDALNRRLRQVLAAASEVAIIATDTDGLISLFNRGAERMLGYGADEVVGSQTPLLFHLHKEIGDAGGPASYQALVGRAARTGSDSREWTYVRKDGSRFDGSTVVTPMVAEDGMVTGYLAVVQDITERKRAERRLRESEERFRTMIEETTDWVWETDEFHRFVALSAGFDTVVGIPAATLIGRRRWDLASESHEMDPTRWQAHIEDLTALRAFRDFRYWIRTGEGQAKWISISGVPRFGEDGRFLGYRGSGSDVTAFADTSLRLRTMSKVVDQSPVSVVITDTAGAITYVNPHFLAITGYAPDEIIGRNSSLLSSGETPPETYRALWATITGGATWSGELKNRRKDGSFHWEQEVIFPVTNDEGRLAYFVSIKEDVTARKEAEARLLDQMELTRRALEAAEQARRRTDLLLSSAGEGIIGIGADEVVAFVNPAAFQILGYGDEAEVIGRNCHAITGHAAGDGSPCRADTCGVLRTLRDGQPRRSETDLFRRRDGSAFPVEFSVTVLAEQDGISGAVVVFHDISARRAAELALAEAHAEVERQAAELSRINAELEQFAYVASHDLRQPLRMVTSYLGLIERRLGKDLSEDLRTFIGFAVDGAKRMDRLILDLLDYSRTGRNAGPFTPVALAEAVADSLGNLELAIGDAGAEVTVADALPEIPGNRTDLGRLFQNLIGNAIKYRSPDRPPRITISCRAEGPHWQVRVCDNGMGIAAEDRERAFQIFQRLVPGQSCEGTGIGLAVCRKIMESHGGRIWIEAVAGGGTCFAMAFPKDAG